MFFTRIVSVFTLAAFVAAAPVARQVSVDVGVQANVTDVLSTLQASVDKVVPELASLAGKATEENALSVVQDLANALSTAKSSLSALAAPATSVVSDVAAGVIKRDASEDVANTLNTIISSIGGTLNPLVAELSQIPAVGEVLQTVIPTVNAVVGEVETIIPGVTALLVGLLGTVTGILGSLGLNDLLGGLGL